jgi:drug/metabolite transporter (DMT)-like permease
MDGTPSRARGVALGIVAACTYGIGPVLIKVALEDMSASTLLLYRLVLAAALLWALLALTGRLRETPRRTAPWLGPLALGAVAYGGQMTLFALALERISASLVVILFHTAPIVVVAVTALTGREPLTRLRLVALALGVGGVAVVAVASGEVRAEPLGIVLAVGSALAYAGVVLGTDAYAGSIAPLPLSVLLATGAALALLIAAPPVGAGTPGDASGWLLVVAIAVVVGVIGTTALLAGVAMIGPSLASILLTLEPLVALLLAWVALDERLSALQLAGGALIIVAAIVAHRAAAEPVPGASLA